ncbi:MAG: hypothetical protein ACSLFQ_01495 [Thermoanaerobaculia bacterium]
MKAPTVILSNVVPGTGSTIFSCDVRVDITDGLGLTIRDARFLEASSGGGRFVGFPRRQRRDGFVKSLEFEGPAGAAIVAAIRDAMKAQLATQAELAEVTAGGDDDRPF